jgi:aerobic carbon-monoxide dehydrogenase large subunit
MSALGQAVRRREDLRFLTGKARYVDDLAEPPGTLHVAFVRSTEPHARFVLDASACDAVVLTAGDIRAGHLPAGAIEDGVVAAAGHPVLARERVRYVGEPIALVCAASRADAEDAAERVRVEYEPLPVVLDPRRASELPPVHTGVPDNTLVRWSRTAGDVEAAFARAAHVISGRFALPRVAAAPIEARGALAEYRADDDLLTVWCSAQDPHRPLAQLSHALGRDRERFRIVVPDVGGAFGSKGAVAIEVAAVAAGALALRRPLKWTEDRLENFLASYHGRGIEADVELALDPGGRMLAIRAKLYADLGAYLFPTTAVPGHTTAMLMTGAYEIPAAQVELVGAATNKVPTGPYRGAGRPEAAYFLERLVDAGAAELGIDPIELRRRNLVQAFPHQTPLGWVYDSGDYERCLDRALELIDVDARRRDRERARAEGGAYGIGTAMYIERSGGLWETAEVERRLDGGVIVRTSSSPHGQGHETVFAQIAADELGIDAMDVEVRWGDTAETPPGIGTFGSRSIAMGGSALVLALRKLKEEGGEWASARFESHLVFASGAYAAAVELVRETGQLHVRAIAAVDDAGRIVNPLLAEGQVYGGAVQGLGELLLEEIVYDDAGQLRTASFVDYGLPTAAEVPPLEAAFVETPSPLNPLGAKGIGEGGAIGTLPAVANAVADALGFHLDPPYTAERVWHALRRAR